MRACVMHPSLNKQIDEERPCEFNHVLDMWRILIRTNVFSSVIHMCFSVSFYVCCYCCCLLVIGGILLGMLNIIYSDYSV